jgi:hypothetical protein
MVACPEAGVILLDQVGVGDLRYGAGLAVL